jgi:hypothetical protein
LSNTLLAAGWDQFQPFVNQPVVLIIERSGMEEGKIATAWHSLRD